MRNLYQAKVEQYAGSGYLHHEATFNIAARSMNEAMRRLRALFKGKDFLKSKPVEILSIERTATNVR